MTSRCLPRFVAAVLWTAFVVSSGTAQLLNQPQAGVEIDAAGVVRMRAFPDPTGQLTRQRIAQVRATMRPELARSSELRKVSLTRLERILTDGNRQGQGITEEMQFLAGLTGIEYVFVYPESGDIVIAGPAEGFMRDLSGRAIGMDSGRAVLELQDLVVALRAYPPSANPVTIGCSIDPTPEGLQRMREYMARMSGQVTPADAAPYAEGMRQSLGLQTVTISGISPKTHFAQVMVEADYRMKLIGIGLEIPPVKISSFIQKASPSQVARNALQRWYFVPDYEAVRVSDDGMAMQLVGDGVKLISEDEMVQADGTRTSTRRINRASRQFATSFSDRYSALAAKLPVYAQLRNVMDLSILAAFLQQYDFYGKVNWRMPLFGSEQRFAVEKFPEARQVESAINVVWKGSTLMTPIGGGVEIDADRPFADGRVAYDEEGTIASTRESITLPADDPNQWWWD